MTLHLVMNAAKIKYIRGQYRVHPITAEHHLPLTTRLNTRRHRVVRRSCTAQSQPRPPFYSS